MPVRGTLGAAIALGLAASRPQAAAVGPPRPGPEDACLVPAVEPREVAQLLAGGLAVLRRAGHSPAGYALELEVPPGGGEPSVVFWPRGDAEQYAVAVRPEDPCVLSWVWRPERFTAWQVALIERARSLLRGAPSVAELADVSVVETAETVTVRLRRGPRGAPGREGSESEVTLLKADLSRASDAGTGAPGD